MGPVQGTLPFFYVQQLIQILGLAQCTRPSFKVLPQSRMVSDENGSEACGVFLDTTSDSCVRVSHQ